MENFGRLLIISGIVLVLIGLLFILSGKIHWLGKLPGDIVIKKENFTFYFPLATSIVVSVVLTIIFLFIGKK